MVKMTIEDEDGDDMVYQVNTKDEMIDVLLRLVEANIGEVTVSSGEFTEESLLRYNEGYSSETSRGVAPLPSFFRFWFGRVGFDADEFEPNGP